MAHVMAFRKTPTRSLIKEEYYGEYQLLVFTFKGQYYLTSRLRHFPNQDFSDTLGRQGINKVFLISRPANGPNDIELLFKEVEALAEQRGIKHLINFPKFH